jgi:tagaturonate reductase
MTLTKNNLHQISNSNLEAPNEMLFNLPEKVLQFGTGVLLRALPDYFIDKANKQGIFNGRIVVVKSTDSDSTPFHNQDGLYTVCVRGKSNGKDIVENIINATISRVISAKSDWQSILDCAANPEMQIVLSNTTEIGITFVNEKITNEMPSSFPGKLLAFLLKRYKVFNGAATSGMVIVPTELITDNGNKLKSIVLDVAEKNNLDVNFIKWLNEHNHFCNTLVDRIVPGKPNTEEQQKIETELGYKDELICMCEPFRLWAIEGDEKVKNILSFSTVDEGMIIVSDITLFKELKLRLLNGTHTFNCGTAFLSGFNITRDAVLDPVYGSFTKKLMTEISIAIPYKIDDEVKKDFVTKVFERFCNPYIDHQWQSITVQYTSKMKMRNVPLITNYFADTNEVPSCMALGFAAFLLYMKVTKKDGDKYYGTLQNEAYLITDDSAAYFYELWNGNETDAVVDKVLTNVELWGTNLAALPLFATTIKTQLQLMLQNGVASTVQQLVNKNEFVHET